MAAYLMREEGLSRDEVLASVKRARAVADPNEGFLVQLQQWQELGCTF